mmetsp:Transcript_2486/g.5595  ORF Transcript_2486/g.5595 Transcript_2486/m.5595 type:complete len:341 (-) Transcript_2486:95-1117(-)
MVCWTWVATLEMAFSVRARASATISCFFFSWSAWNLARISSEALRRRSTASSLANARVLSIFSTWVYVSTRASTERFACCWPEARASSARSAVASPESIACWATASSCSLSWVPVAFPALSMVFGPSTFAISNCSAAAFFHARKEASRTSTFALAVVSSVLFSSSFSEAAETSSATLADWMVGPRALLTAAFVYFFTSVVTLMLAAEVMEVMLASRSFCFSLTLAWTSCPLIFTFLAAMMATVLPPWLASLFTAATMLSPSESWAAFCLFTAAFTSPTAASRGPSASAATICRVAASASALAVLAARLAVVADSWAPVFASFAILADIVAWVRAASACAT